jgi:hypothetical protein
MGKSLAPASVLAGVRLFPIHHPSHIFVMEEREYAQYCDCFVTSLLYTILRVILR